MMKKQTADGVPAKIAVTRAAILTLLSLSVRTATAATGTVNHNTVYPQLEGFGLKSAVNYSVFTAQRMQCNGPQDAGYVPNW